MAGLEYYRSPIGILALHSKGKAITSIRFDPKPVLDTEKPSPVTTKCKEQLAAYFKGEITGFSIPLVLEGTPFQKRVWEMLQTIPYGRSLSYADLAVKLGDLKAIRAVGTANGKNKIPIIIPCHRVIGKDGSLTGFSGGLDKKAWLLRHEGAIGGHQMTLFQ